MKTSERQQEALTRATTFQSLTNYPTIYQGFMDKGIPEAEIQPRVNVFTYEAWRALGRQVRKGEHGVRVVTFADCERPSEDPNDLNEDGTVKTRHYRRPWSTVVFHVSQTDAKK